MATVFHYTMLWECHFEIEGIRYSVGSKGGVSRFNKGFFITEDFKLVKGSQISMIWVPPSAILYIERVKK